MKESMKDDTTLIDEVLRQIPNKYMAVIAVSKRARAVNDGARPLVNIGVKPTTIAMAEIAAGAFTTAELAKILAEETELLPPPDSPTEKESDDSMAEEPEDTSMEEEK